MRQNKKLLALFVVSLTLMFGVSVASAERSKADPAPIPIGAILSLTGEIASFGVAIQQGMELAMADGSSADFRLIYEDDRSVSKVAAVNAAKKLVDVDRVPVVLNMVASTASSIAPVLKSGNAAGIIVWDSNEEISKMESMVGMGYGTEVAAEALADYAVKKLGAKRIAIISALDEWAAVYSAAFNRRIKELGAEIVFSDLVNPSESNFKPLIGRIRAADAEVTLGVLYTGALVSWIRQSPLQGYKGTLMTADAVSEVEIQAAGPAAEGLYASQVWVENADLERKYAAKYGQAANRLNVGFVSIGYDAVRCLSKLKSDLEARELPFAPDTILGGLEGFSCPGTAGTFSISPQRLSDKKERVVTVKGGRFELAP